MIKKADKNAERRQRAKRTADIHGTAKKPRLSVYRSLGNIYAQLIDDDKGETMVAVNTLQDAIQKMTTGKPKQEQAVIVGRELGKLAMKKKIETCVFDRNGYRYTGRIKNVADGAREGGLKF